MYKNIYILVDENDDNAILKLINEKLLEEPKELNIFFANLKGFQAEQRDVIIDAKKITCASIKTGTKISFFIVNSKIALILNNLETPKIYGNKFVKISDYGSTITIKHIFNYNDPNVFQIYSGCNYIIEPSL